MQRQPTTPSDTEQAFAPVPTWERNKRSKSMFGARKTSVSPGAPERAPIEEPRSFSEVEATPTPSSRMADRVVAGKPRTVTAIDETPEIEDSRGMAGGEAFVATPAYVTGARKTAARKGGVSPIAITAGVAAVAVIAAGAWYASQPRGGVDTITPSTQAMQVADAAAPAPTPTPAASTQMAQADVAPPAAVTASAPAPTRVASVSRPARAAPAASVDSAAVNTSATLPEAPVPYGQIPQVATGGTVAPAPGVAPSAATPVVTPAPVAAAPATTVPAAPASVAPTQPTPVNPAPEATTQPGADMTSNPTP
jgi:hypothetical protein